MNPHTRLLDLCALLVLLLYAWITWSAYNGGSLLAAPLDPVWVRVQRSGTLRVATDVGFRPFADDQNGQLIGYDIDLARAVAAKLGVEVQFVPTGFDALYDSLTSRKADMIASALPYAPEQGYRARFSVFYFNAGQVLVVRDDSPIADLADLPDQRVGVALGSDADATMRRHAAEDDRIRLDSTYETPEQAIADLRRGSLDAVVTDNVAALIAVQGQAGLRIASALTFEPYALAVPREAFQLHAAVNVALEEHQDEGFLTALNARWLR